MTYQLDPSIQKSYHIVELQILQVCKKLFAQATKLFYRRKTSSFTSALTIPAAVAFFADRSLHTMNLIQSVEMRVQEVLRSWSTEGDYPEHNASSILRYTYGSYTRLCGLLSSPGAGIKKLSLFIEGRAEYMWSLPTTLPTIRTAG